MNIIRISLNEYDQIDGSQEYFAHFNLEQTNHVVGNTYALAKIIKNGSVDFKTGIEIPPQLSVENVYITECIKVENNLAYKDITPEHFRYSMKSIKNIEELEHTIAKRYSQVRKGITAEEIHQKGVGFTLLKILKRQ